MYRSGLDPRETRTGSHAEHFLGSRAQDSVRETYALALPSPKSLFMKKCPLEPRTLGEEIRKARLEAGLEIKEVADMLGVCKSTIYKWEVRGRKLSKKNLVKLEGLSALTTNWLRFRA